MIDSETRDRVVSFFANFQASVLEYLDAGLQVHVNQKDTCEQTLEDQVIDGFIVTIYGGRPAVQILQGKEEAFGVNVTAE